MIVLYTSAQSEIDFTTGKDMLLTSKPLVALMSTIKVVEKR